MPTSRQIEVEDLEGTEALGRRLGKLLFPGAVVSLVGQLGAGKTHLVRAVAQGLGIADARQVNSPTFVLIQEYQARLPIYHFDAYRLGRPEDFLDLGVEEYFQSEGVCLIEWGDKVAGCLPAEHLEITLKITGETSRLVILAPQGGRYEQLVRELEECR